MAEAAEAATVVSEMPEQVPSNSCTLQGGAAGVQHPGGSDCHAAPAPEAACRSARWGCEACSVPAEWDRSAMPRLGHGQAPRWQAEQAPQSALLPALHTAPAAELWMLDAGVSRSWWQRGWGGVQLANLACSLCLPAVLPARQQSSGAAGSSSPPAHLARPGCAHLAGGYCMLVGATLKPRTVMDLAAGLVLNITI